MSHKNYIFSYLILILLNISCQKENFKEYTKLEEMRVLALQSSAAEVNPCDTVTITPFISDITNSGPYTYAAKACLDPGVAYGASPTCVGNATAVDLGTGTVGGLSSPNFTGNGTAFNVTVPTTILALSSDVDKYNGVIYLVTYEITNSQAKTVTSFHRILVTDSKKTNKNSLPVISSILGNGATLGTVATGSQITVNVNLTTASSEIYSYKKSDGSLSSNTESPLITYFYTDGKMKFFRTTLAESNIYTAPDSYPSTRNSFIVVVVRDGRGGISLQSITVN